MSELEIKKKKKLPWLFGMAIFGALVGSVVAVLMLNIFTADPENAQSMPLHLMLIKMGVYTLVAFSTLVPFVLIINQLIPQLSAKPIALLTKILTLALMIVIYGVLAMLVLVFLDDSPTEREEIEYFAFVKVVIPVYCLATLAGLLALGRRAL